jgi:hypothetical protein
MKLDPKVSRREGDQRALATIRKYELLTNVCVKYSR